MFYWFKKEKKTCKDSQDSLLGVYTLSNDINNPFEDTEIHTEVLEVKQGYVRYKFLNIMGPAKYSSKSIEYFLLIYRKV